MDHALETEWVQINDLRPHPQNPRNGDIDLIVESLKVNGLYKPIVSTQDGTILAGNHTYAAAAQLGWERIAVVRIPVDPFSAEAKRIMLADNRTADVGRYDTGLLLELLQGMDEDLLGTGYNGDDVDDMERLMGTIVDEPIDPHWEKYSSSVGIPQYEPQREEPPALSELVDTDRMSTLMERIDTVDVPDEVATFLRLAATRHARFDYRNIAEYYAHATPEVQALMEDSALVIIDFKDAIAKGYARISDYLETQEVFDEDE